VSGVRMRPGIPCKGFRAMFFLPYCHDLAHSLLTCTVPLHQVFLPA
jgi:hypothetical protein